MKGHEGTLPMDLVNVLDGPTIDIYQDNDVTDHPVSYAPQDVDIEDPLEYATTLSSNNFSSRNL